MQFDAFAAGNPKELTYKEEHAGKQKELLDTADQWSDFFNDALHNYLTTDTRTDRAQTISCLDSYREWSRDEFAPLFNQLLDGHWTERSAELLNRLHFHVLTNAFTQQWQRILTRDQVSPETHKNQIDYAQVGCIFHASEQMRARGKVPVSEYYDRQNKKERTRRSTIEGMLTELDAAIVITEYYKNNPNIIVIPSPSSFEHGTERSSQTNSDFIVIDAHHHEAIGVQVKAAFSEREYSRYDLEYVVPVDGDIDLNDIGSRRDKLRKVCYVAGSIAAEHTLSLPMHGKGRSATVRSFTEGKAGRDMLAAKMTARQIISPHSHTEWAAAQRVGSRIDRALYPSSSQE